MVSSATYFNVYAQCFLFKNKYVKNTSWENLVLLLNDAKNRQCGHISCMFEVNFCMIMNVSFWKVGIEKKKNKNSGLWLSAKWSTQLSSAH